MVLQSLLEAQKFQSGRAQLSKTRCFWKGTQKIQQPKRSLAQSQWNKKTTRSTPKFSLSLSSTPCLNYDNEQLGTEKYIVLWLNFTIKCQKMKLIHTRSYQVHGRTPFVLKSKMLLHVLMSSLFSDASSIVSKFLLLNKPVITFKNKTIHSDNSTSHQELVDKVTINLSEDSCKDKCSHNIEEYQLGLYRNFAIPTVKCSWITH